MEGPASPKLFWFKRSIMLRCVTGKGGKWLYNRGKHLNSFSKRKKKKKGTFLSVFCSTGFFLFDYLWKGDNKIVAIIGFDSLSFVLEAGLYCLQRTGV